MIKPLNDYTKGEFIDIRTALRSIDDKHKDYSLSADILKHRDNTTRLRTLYSTTDKKTLLNPILQYNMSLVEILKKLKERLPKTQKGGSRKNKKAFRKTKKNRK